MFLQCDKCDRTDGYLTISNSFTLCQKCLKKHNYLKEYNNYLSGNREKKKLKIERRKNKNLYKIKARNSPHPKSHTLISLISKYGDFCFYCKRANPDTKDHVNPKSRGGTNRKENLRPCCYECNQKKGNMSVSEFMSKFRPNN